MQDRQFHKKVKVPSKMTWTDKCWEGKMRVSDMGTVKRRGVEWRGVRVRGNVCGDLWQEE